MFSPTLKNESESNVKNSVNDKIEGLQEAANSAGRKVRSAFNAASDEMSHVSDKVTAEIRTNPVQSSVIALGVGMLLGMLIRR